MKKNIKILTLLTSALISIVSVNSMEQSEKKEINFIDALSHSKIDVSQLPEAKIEIIMHRKRVGSTPLEQDTFDALDNLKAESEKIDIQYLNKELKNRDKEEALGNIKADSDSLNIGMNF